MTKYPEKINHVDEQLDLDDCIMNGDTLAANILIEGFTKSFCILKIKTIKDKSRHKKVIRFLQKR